MDVSALGRRLAEASSHAAPDTVRLSRREATVSRVNGDGTVDLDLGGGGRSIPLDGVRCASSCVGLSVGDRVLLDTVGHVSVVTASLARHATPRVLYDNGFWKVVDHGGMLSCTARNVKVPADPYGTLDCKYNVPAGLRPAVECLAACVTQSGDSGAGFIRVKADGNISIGQLGGAGTAEPRYGQVVWAPGI